MDGLSVLVPSSVVREAGHPREATRKLGTVARAAAVFRADRLVVFPDREGERRFGEAFVRNVLSYAATPPYLRKDVWGQRDELEYVGVLPPLRVSSRTSADPEGPVDREGIVTEVGSEGRVRVNCGLQHPISLVVPPEMAPPREGERVTVRISSREPVRARLVDEPPPGFDVETADLSDALARATGPRIATSRYGQPVSGRRLADDLLPQVRNGATVAFGSPGRGLPAILGVDPEAVVAADGGPVEPNRWFDLWLNTIPRQGSEVVRTEEAVWATLSLLSLTE